MMKSPSDPLIPSRTWDEDALRRAMESATPGHSSNAKANLKIGKQYRPPNEREIGEFDMSILRHVADHGPIQSAPMCRKFSPDDYEKLKRALIRLARSGLIRSKRAGTGYFNIHEVTARGRKMAAQDG